MLHQPWYVHKTRVSSLLPHSTHPPNPTPNTKTARSFGTAVVGHYWRLHWIWWVAPLLGGLAASLMYSILFYFQETPKEEESRSGLSGLFPRMGNRTGRTTTTGGPATMTTTG